MAALDTPRERQPREHPVPCTWCRARTFDLDAVCTVCRDAGRTRWVREIAEAPATSVGRVLTSAEGAASIAAGGAGDREVPGRFASSDGNTSRPFRTVDEVLTLADEIDRAGAGVPAQVDEGRQAAASLPATPVGPMVARDLRREWDEAVA